MELLSLISDISDLQLDEHCLFCLNKCTKQENLLSRNEGVLQVIFSKTTLEGCKTFRNLFWKLLGGVDSKSLGVKNNTAQFKAESSGGVEILNDEGNQEVCESPTLEDGEGHVPNVPICSFCLGIIMDVRELYTKLETIQMLFIEQIANLQRVIRGSHYKTQEWKQNLQINEAINIPVESMNKLVQFQEKVMAHVSNSTKVPLVLLNTIPNLVRPLVIGDRSKVNKNKLIDNSDESPMVPPLRKKRRGRPPHANTKTSDPLQVKTDETEDTTKLDNLDTDWSPPQSPDLPNDVHTSDEDEYIPDERPQRSKKRPPKYSDLISEPVPEKRRVGRPKKNSNSNSTLLPKVKNSTRKVHHSIFRCEICSKVYFKRITFLKHQLAHKEGTIPQTREDNNSDEFDEEETKVCQVCEELLPESDYNSHMMTHETLDPTGDHPDKKLFSCSHKDCIRKFQLEENLKIHMEVDHDEINSRCMITVKKCDVCNVCYDTSSDLLEHMRKNHQDLKKNRIICPICAHCFTSPENMIIHIHTHSAPVQQICFMCPSKFSNRTELLHHFRTEHDLKTSGECSFCNENFEDVYWLKVHVRSFHKVKELLVCSFCGKTCSQPRAFMRHYKSKHKVSEKSGLPCESCNDKFRNEDKLLKHRIQIHGAPKLECEQCGIKHSTVSGLNLHMKTHSGEGFTCEVCGKCFSRKLNLQQHMACHSDKRPYTCEVCGFGSKNYWQFRKHTDSHNKRYDCEVCGRKFTRYEGLKNHLKMHTGEVTPCPYCGYEFHSQKSLNCHLQKYHVGEQDQLKSLYPPQKRRNPRSFWYDDDGNKVYAKNLEEKNERKQNVEIKTEQDEPDPLQPSSSPLDGVEIIPIV